MEDIVLLHRKTNKIICSEFPAFTTCLRQVVFIPKDKLEIFFSRFPSESSDELLIGESATAFMISILCGLHSPVFGETEVFGQFKTFWEEQKNNSQATWLHAQSKKWINYLFQQVKDIRSQYLSAQGPGNYGSFARQFFQGQKQITIFGSGQLSQQIAPYLIEQSEVSIVSRNPEKSLRLWPQELKTLKFLPYKLDLKIPQGLVIAAPMELLDLAPYLQIQRPERILDLRRKPDREGAWPFSSSQYCSLEDFFNEMSKTQKRNEGIKAQLLNLSQDLAKQYSLRSDFRPMGWDDICA